MRERCSATGLVASRSVCLRTPKPSRWPVPWPSRDIASRTGSTQTCTRCRLIPKCSSIPPGAANNGVSDARGRSVWSLRTSSKSLGASSKR